VSKEERSQIDRLDAELAAAIAKAVNEVIGHPVNFIFLMPHPDGDKSVTLSTVPREAMIGILKGVIGSSTVAQQTFRTDYEGNVQELSPEEERAERLKGKH
jgi:hypothetical protein